MTAPITAFPIPTAAFTDYIDNVTLVQSILAIGGITDDRLSYHNGDLPAAVSAHISGGSIPTVFVMDMNATVTPSGSSLTVPPTMVVAWGNVSQLTMANDKSLVISQMPLDPGPQKRFVLGNSNSHVTFAPGAVNYINTAWYTGPGTSAGVAVDRAIEEALLSCAGGVAQSIYTPWGKWTGTGNHIIPRCTTFFGDGKFATVFYNTSSTTPFFKIIPGTQFVVMRDFQINSPIGQTTTGTGILFEGSFATETSGTAGFSFRDLIFQGGHWGIRINAGVEDWSVVDLEIDKSCWMIGCDINFENNCQNTNIEYKPHQLVSWIQTDSPSPGDGYSQYLGKMVKCGPLTITGEQGGLFPAGDEFGYGRHQRQMITVQAGDNITVAGTAQARVVAAGMRGDGSLVAGGAFTAVAATDICTLAAHGFYTGLNVRVTTAGVLPQPLAIETDYWVIVINANTFYLADTQAHAIAGTHINLLTDGTPVNTITAQASAFGSPVLIDIPLARTGGAFTALAATDIITLAGHGYQTGQSVILTTAGVLPVPLAVSTTYYVIVIDANTFYLATSLVNAFAGTHINLNTDGTPVNTIAAVGADVTIAAQIRFCLGHNPWISSFFHVTKTFTVDYSLDTRVNLIPIEAAATDTTMSFSWVPGTCTGLTTKSTSVRTAGTADKLAQGWEFTGGHYGTLWLNAVDEGINSLVIANADEIESQYMFVGGIVQGAIRANKKCTINVTGTEGFDRFIRDGGTGPVGSPTYYGSPRVQFDGTIQYYSNIWVDDGTGDKVGSIELMQCRRDSNFANITGDNYNNGMHSQRIDNHEQIVDSNYDWTFYSSADEATANSGALIPSIRAQLNLVSYDVYGTKDMLFIGNGDTLGNGRFGYGARRVATGALRLKGNQGALYSALLTDKIYASGLISEVHPDSSSPDITANTINYNPTFLWDQNAMQVKSQGGSWILRSMQAPTPANGAMYNGWNGVFTNVSNSNTLTLPNEDLTGGVTAEYRFLTPGAVDFYLGPQCSCYLYYDLVRLRWIVADLGILTTTITNGDLSHAPNGDAVFDALALKAGGNATDNLGYLNVPGNAKSANYTTVLADAGKSIDHPATDANARNFTIDSNANVAYPVGTCISFSNMTSQVVTIKITSDTMYLAGSGATGDRSLAQYGVATARKILSTTWLISGIGLT